jgi:hypothetical protein
MVWIVGTTVSFMEDAISDIKGKLDKQRCMRRQRRLERLSDAERTCLAMRGDMSALESITNLDELNRLLQKLKMNIYAKMACGKLGHQWHGLFMQNLRRQKYICRKRYASVGLLRLQICESKH